MGMYHMPIASLCGPPFLVSMQGKECVSLFLLIEGEVEVVVDLPYSDDRELLESALTSKMQVSIPQ
jgi:hypothetical protein